MKKLFTSLSTLAILLLLAPVSSMALNKQKFCINYANIAVKQYNQAKQYHLPDIYPPTWSSDNNGHYNWCMTVPKSFANSENDKRQIYLNQYLSKSISTSKNNSKLPLDQNTANTERENQLSHYNNLDKRQRDEGANSEQGSSGGIGGITNKPGGNGEPGSGNKTPPFEDSNGLDNMYGNKAGHRPDDHIKDPDQMGEYDTGSPAQELYGPSGKPLPSMPGAKKGKGKWFYFGTRSAIEVCLLTSIGDENDPGIGHPEKDSTGVGVWKNTDGRIRLVFMYHHGPNVTYTQTAEDSNKFTCTFAPVIIKKSNSSKSINGSGDKSSHDPLSVKEKIIIMDAKAIKALNDLLNYTPIHNNGGVVDPMYKQAKNNGNKNEKGDGQAAGKGKTPKVAKRPGSQRPGSQLTGPGRVDKPTVDKNVKLPQGFHVIDPAAIKGAVHNNANSNKEQSNKVK